MTQLAAAVLADALRLDEHARVELAAEIERRVAAIEAGTAALEPWGDVRRRIERDVLGR